MEETLVFIFFNFFSNSFFSFTRVFTLSNIDEVPVFNFYAIETISFCAFCVISKA